MGCCGGSNRQGNKRIKEWGNEQNQSSLKQSPMLIITVLLFLGLIFYKFGMFSHLV